MKKFTKIFLVVCLVLVVVIMVNRNINRKGELDSLEPKHSIGDLENPKADVGTKSKTKTRTKYKTRTREAEGEEGEEGGPKTSQALEPMDEDQRVEKNNEILSYLGKLKEVYNCYESQTCDFPSEDPREYDLAVGQKLKEDLIDIYKQVDEYGISNKAIVQNANFYLEVPDGHVKEAALLLLESQAESLRNTQGLEAVLTNVVDYHDASLIPPALKVLSHYSDDKEAMATITSAFHKALATGSPFVARKLALALALGPFINQNNVSGYEKLLNKLPQNSIVKKNLKESIEEYKRYVTGH